MTDKPEIRRSIQSEIQWRTFNVRSFGLWFSLHVAEASKGPKNSVELKDNLAKLKDLEGVTGTMSIDKNQPG